jgi:hypothetical protein
VQAAIVVGAIAFVVVAVIISVLNYHKQQGCSDWASARAHGLEYRSLMERCLDNQRAGIPSPPP